MVNYQNGRIYKLYSDDCDLVYYGSTSGELCKRLYNHKNRSANSCTSKKMFEISSNVHIVLVESYPCDNKHELESRERWYIENNSCINRAIPTRTKQEYRITNREKISHQKKSYYKANREKKLQQRKVYREANRGKVAQCNKAWCEANREKISQREKVYREANRDKRKNQAQYRTSPFGSLCKTYGIFD